MAKKSEAEVLAEVVLAAEAEAMASAEAEAEAAAAAEAEAEVAAAVAALVAAAEEYCDTFDFKPQEYESTHSTSFRRVPSQGVYRFRVSTGTTPTQVFINGVGVPADWQQGAGGVESRLSLQPGDEVGLKSWTVKGVAVHIYIELD